MHLYASTSPPQIVVAGAVTRGHFGYLPCVWNSLAVAYPAVLDRISPPEFSFAQFLLDGFELLARDGFGRVGCRQRFISRTLAGAGVFSELMVQRFALFILSWVSCVLV